MERQAPRPTYVALDTETTGLDSEHDAIIEIGAVKFMGREAIDTFQTLVNPYREIPPFIRQLTGITQKSVDAAPPFAAVAGELSEFLGQHPVVGHNVSFDLKFLAKHGLRLDNEAYDTWDLASVLLPYGLNYSLSSLAKELGPENDQPHRALSDAEATHQVFVSLLERAGMLDLATGLYVRHLAAKARWPAGRLLGAQLSPAGTGVSSVGITGLDMDSLGKRLEGSRRSLKTVKGIPALDPDGLETYLAPGGIVSRAFSGYEHRQEQVGMMRAVSAAMNGGEHLIVEAGTGVGKSLAYLLPGILYALANGSRVVVSTNTINLQEQLLQKDIPALVGALEGGGIIPKGEFKFVSLKGRDNYLCLRQWDRLARSESLSTDEARLLSKTLVWLQDTSTGDKGEINLSGKDAFTWSLVSAGQKGQCPGTRGDGPCFLRTARDRAEGAHMVVVNHSLLLADLAMGGGLIPEYQHLIVDEAHHLEEGATQQMGFQVSQNRLQEELGSLGRLLEETRLMLRQLSAPAVDVRKGEELVAAMESHWMRRVRDDWERLWGLAESFMNHQQESREQFQLRVTRSSRAQPGWSDLEVAWENADLSLTDGLRQADRLSRFLETIQSEGPVEPAALATELSAWMEGVEELEARLKALVAGAFEEQRIDWMVRMEEGRGESSPRSYVVLRSAPLNVGPELDSRLFSPKTSVVLTSATLSTQGNFNYIRERIGLSESKELLVGSPFDYKRAATLLIADDIPTPETWGYQDAVEKLLAELAKALDGHILALFTSHAALRGAARALRVPMEGAGIRVFAQNLDGAPARLLRSFAEDPRGVILGTSSFWEGVDLPGGLLRSLVIAKLPFHVPTEPVFQARSEQYEDSFHQYALPQAVLRFRQGIGRLIRGSQDRGSIVLLDRRITSKSYGKAFLDSLPPCNVKRLPMAAIPGEAAAWSRIGS